MRCQVAQAARLAITAITALAACGHKGDKDSPDETGDSKGCAASRFTVELADEKSAPMKAMYDHVDQDKSAPKIGVYPQLDEWKDAAGVTHTDYRLAGSDRAIIESYLAARAKADPKLAPAKDRAIRFEKTFASGRTYWRTHYVITPPLIDGTGVASAEVAPSTAQVIVHLTPDGKAKLVAATAAHVGKKLVLRVGDTVMAAPPITVPFDERLLLSTAEEKPEANAQVAAQTAKQLSCAP